MKSPRRRARRGFTLLTLITLLAVGAVAATILIVELSSERDILLVQRQREEAREAAEGGLMEVLNAQGLSYMLPEADTPNLEVQYTPPAQSVFDNPTVYRGRRSYDATIRLVRMAPMLESSHSVVRAVLFEVAVDAEAGDGTTAGVEAEVYRVVSSQSGMIQPRVHGR